MKSLGLSVFAILTAVMVVFGQDPHAFEVASVKLEPWNGQGSVGIFVRGNTLTAEHVSLNELVAFAYNLRDVQLSGGPGWADRSQAKLSDAELYQVIAKAVGDSPPSMDQFRRMLQSLLTDRFQLKVHHQPKDLPVYNLVVNKGGPKLTESTAGTAFTVKTSSIGRYGIRIETKAMTMAKLVGNLSVYAARPVFDKTGLAGTYDFTLECVVENLAAGVADIGGPSIFTALQEQLGLKLESATAPFDTVVIDHAERLAPN
jgi:uncharacterized protein (TIGR03435 family)